MALELSSKGAVLGLSFEVDVKPIPFQEDLEDLEDCKLKRLVSRFARLMEPTKN